MTSIKYPPSGRCTRFTDYMTANRRTIAEYMVLNPSMRNESWGVKRVGEGAFRGCVEGEERKRGKLTLSPIEGKKGWGSWIVFGWLMPHHTEIA